MQIPVGRRPRLAFVHAPQVYYDQTYGARFGPMWASTLAAYVDQAWEMDLVDFGVDDVNAVAPADVFLFSGINQDLASLWSAHTALKARFPNACFALGGPITWSFEQAGKLHELLSFDHVFILDGEETLPAFLRDVLAGKKIPQIIRAERFDITRSRRLDFRFMTRRGAGYYGGVVEVSRGCPFLCEFCDIRVLPQNNEAHNRDPRLVVEELAEYHRLGVRQVQLACDNFIGEPAWANACVDAILEWTQRTGARLALHTWVTVNLARQHELMRKMRHAGFTSLFIGVESFNAHSVLETGKVQNKNDEQQMVKALQDIQSFGFIIAPGLIFGFDSDPPEIFDLALDGVVKAGLLGGDPTFLLALPGTPLFDRMKALGRLVNDESDRSGLPLHKERVSKIESNIRFLQPQEFLVQGYLRFMKRYMSPEIAYARFRRHVEIIVKGGHLVPGHAVGYGNVQEYLRAQVQSLENARRLVDRLRTTLHRDTAAAVGKALMLVARHWRT